jgi:redox-sensitive transcriptional activator SoxR
LAGRIQHPTIDLERTYHRGSALHFYERQGLISSVRTPGNQRRYARSVLRRLAIIQVAQRVGIPLKEIAKALNALPEGGAPTRLDWTRLSAGWHASLTQELLSSHVCVTNSIPASGAVAYRFAGARFTTPEFCLDIKAPARGCSLKNDS